MSRSTEQDVVRFLDLRFVTAKERSSKVTKYVLAELLKEYSEKNAEELDARSNKKDLSMTKKDKDEDKIALYLQRVFVENIEENKDVTSQSETINTPPAQASPIGPFRIFLVNASSSPEQGKKELNPVVIRSPKKPFPQKQSITSPDKKTQEQTATTHPDPKQKHDTAKQKSPYDRSSSINPRPAQVVSTSTTSATQANSNGQFASSDAGVLAFLKSQSASLLSLPQIRHVNLQHVNLQQILKEEIGNVALGCRGPKKTA
jgi:hypothetical protein